jgi:hypothetical protein
MEYKDFCDFLSAYLDRELDADICAEIDQMLEEDCYCQSLFDTFDKTIWLCQQIEQEMIDVPEEVHIRLIQVIRTEVRKKR